MGSATLEALELDKFDDCARIALALCDCRRVSQTPPRGLVFAKALDFPDSLSLEPCHCCDSDIVEDAAFIHKQAYWACIFGNACAERECLDLSTRYLCVWSPCCTLLFGVLNRGT